MTFEVKFCYSLLFTFFFKKCESGIFGKVTETLAKGKPRQKLNRKHHCSTYLGFLMRLSDSRCPVTHPLNALSLSRYGKTMKLSFVPETKIKTRIFALTHVMAASTMSSGLYEYISLLPVLLWHWQPTDTGPFTEASVRETTGCDCGPTEESCDPATNARAVIDAQVTELSINGGRPRRCFARHPITGDFKIHQFLQKHVDDKKCFCYNISNHRNKV